MNPMYHSKSSVKRWGGKVEDYLEIHELIDSPKSCMNNNTGRMATHNTWFVNKIIPKIFGYNIINSDGKSVDTADIVMLHISEDFRGLFIPTLQDYLKHMVVQPWMNNGVKLVDNPDSIQAAVDLKDKLRKERLEEEETV
jgi:hypothetical protein